MDPLAAMDAAFGPSGHIAVSEEDDAVDDDANDGSEGEDDESSEDGDSDDGTDDDGTDDDDDDDEDEAEDDELEQDVAAKTETVAAEENDDDFMQWVLGGAAAAEELDNVVPAGELCLDLIAQQHIAPQACSMPARTELYDSELSDSCCVWRNSDGWSQEKARGQFEGGSESQGRMDDRKTVEKEEGRQEKAAWC